MRQLPPAPVKMDFWDFNGGLDQTSPPLTIKPGFARKASNFEHDINGGYLRTGGYERYDGRTQPSDAVFYTIPCSTAGTWALGDTVTGGTSGATATYLATSGTNLIVTKVTGTFQAEALNAGGGTATGAQYAGGATTRALAATYQNLAADVYRALITAVPGTGSVLGVKWYSGALYAFRNRANGTSVGLYKSTTGGWSAQHSLELTFNSGGTYVVAVGNTITGATSAATGVVTAVVLRSGTWAGGDAAGSIRIATETGTFASGENLNVGANLNVATLTSAAKATFGRELRFASGGTYEIAAGDTVTGGTSTTTAVVTRVVLESGSWNAGTAAGRLIFANDSADFTPAEVLNVGANLDVATVTAVSSAIVQTVSGRYELFVHNFRGSINSERMYGADGVNRGFEWDGTVFVPINTGMTTDTPKHVCVHAEQLFFSFGPSAQHSGIAEPYLWSAVLGAGEIAVGDTITGFMSQPGSTGAAALLIATRNKAFMLYGNNASDWVLTVAQQDAGVIAYTMQHLNGIIALDDRGVTYVGTSQNYGNFAQNTITRRVQKFINTQRSLSVASCRVREKNQYRLFYSNNKALYITMQGNKVVGMLPIELADTPTCTDSEELTDGTEGIFFGDTTGYVYRMDKGTSFDGDSIDAYLILHYNNLKSPQIDKRFRKLSLEVSGDSYAEMSVSYELGYASTRISQPGASTTIESDLSSADWDGFTWDDFFWDGQALLPESIPLEGTSENISVVITSNSDEFEPFSVTGALLHYTPRMRIR